jgi:hypothetical protein
MATLKCDHCVTAGILISGIYQPRLQALANSLQLIHFPSWQVIPANIRLSIYVLLSI